MEERINNNPSINNKQTNMEKNNENPGKKTSETMEWLCGSGTFPNFCRTTGLLETAMERNLEMSHCP